MICHWIGGSDGAALPRVDKNLCCMLLFLQRPLNVHVHASVSTGVNHTLGCPFGRFFIGYVLFKSEKNGCKAVVSNCGKAKVLSLMVDESVLFGD